MKDPECQMRNEAKLQWLWQGMDVVLLGSMLRVMFLLAFGMGFVTSPIYTAWQVLGGSFLVGLHVGRSVAFTLPTTVLCLFVFAYLVGQTPRKRNESHCRQCGYILRGLSNPRCPECGEAI